MFPFRYLFIVGFLINSLISFSQGLNFSKLEAAVVVVQIFDYQNNQLGHGSGFIIDSKGTVVTNYHVVENAYSIKVVAILNNNKETFDVQYITRGSKDKDLALLSLKNPYNKLFPFLKLALNLPKKGEDCWAIGTPAKEIYMNTVSKGLVSNINKYSNKVILQTNAEISHGSSGGPLFNNKGEVIGITSAGDATEDGSRANINFAIWAGHLKELPVINKSRVVTASQVPGKLSFYTDNQFAGDVYIYINNTYVGNFTKYFINRTPECGEEGTITRILYPGLHSYKIYYASSKQWSYGSVNLTAGSCNTVRVTLNTTPRPYTPRTNTSGSSYPNNDTPVTYERHNLRWVGAAGINNNDGYNSFQISLEKFLNKKTSLRGNIRMGDEAGVQLDLKKYFSSNRFINWFLAPSAVYSSNNTIWTGLKLGADLNWSNNLIVNGDIGYGPFLNASYWGVEVNLSIGYRFGKKL